MTQILLIGGNGFVGKRIRTALETLPSPFHLAVGTKTPRSGKDFFFDVTNQELFDKLKKFDLIINCSDSFVAPPFDVIEYCLVTGLTFLETTADSNIIEKILKTYRPKEKSVETYRGTIILGLGIFPGLSNILVRYLLQNSSKANSIEVGIKTNFFSGAGNSMVKLMIDMIESKPIAYRNFLESEQVPLSVGPIFLSPSSGSGRNQYRSLQARFAESSMLYHSTQAPNIATYYVPSSPFVFTALRLLSTATRRFKFLKGFVLKSIYLSIILIRTLIFRGVGTPVTIFCVVNRTSGDARSVVYRSEDGIRDMSVLLQNVVEILSTKSLRKNVLLPDEVFTVNELFVIKKERLRLFDY